LEQETLRRKQETKTNITVAMINSGKSIDEIEEALNRLLPEM
jgi:hypothetical protein